VRTQPADEYDPATWYTMLATGWAERPGVPLTGPGVPLTGPGVEAPTGRGSLLTRDLSAPEPQNGGSSEKPPGPSLAHGSESAA
jgi:hypothetical protein